MSFGNPYFYNHVVDKFASNFRVSVKVTSDSFGRISLLELNEKFSSNVVALLLLKQNTEILITATKQQIKADAEEEKGTAYFEYNENWSCFPSKSVILSQHLNISSKKVVLDKFPIDIGKLCGNVVILEEKDNNNIPKAVWQPCVDDIKNWKTLAKIAILPSRHYKDSKSLQVVIRYPILSGLIECGTFVAMLDKNTGSLQYMLQPSYQHQYEIIKIYFFNGSTVYVKPLDNGDLVFEHDYEGEEILALDIIYGNEVDRQLPIRDKTFKEPPWGWEECSFVKAVFFDVSLRMPTPETNDYSPVLLEPVSIYYNGREVCIITSRDGYLGFYDETFGHEVQALDITYQGKKYRHLPTIRNTFEEPEWKWRNCEPIEAVLRIPDDCSCVTKNEPHRQTAESDARDALLKLFGIQRMDNKAKVASKRTSRMKILILLSIAMVFIAIYAKLVYFTKQTPEVEVVDEVVVDDEVEVEPSWFSWFVDPSAPPPKPVKPISHLDSLSEIVGRIWKSFINIFPENDEFD